MKLTETLVREACLMEMTARDKPGALRELAEALSAHTPGLSSGGLFELLAEREKLGSTAMGDGIAIPHARIESIDRLRVGFGRCRAGIDFESIDGKLTHLFFVLVAPGREGSAHLLALARLSRFLSREDFRKSLLELGSSDDLIALFGGLELQGES